jgi:hypothetical protein
MDGRVALLSEQCTKHEARLADLEVCFPLESCLSSHLVAQDTLRTEIDRTASLSAELRKTREQLDVCLSIILL